jgi:hypothetical protein
LLTLFLCSVKAALLLMPVISNAIADGPWAPLFASFASRSAFRCLVLFHRHQTVKAPTTATTNSAAHNTGTAHHWDINQVIATSVSFPSVELWPWWPLFLCPKNNRCPKNKHYCQNNDIKTINVEKIIPKKHQNKTSTYPLVPLASSPATGACPVIATTLLSLPAAAATAVNTVVLAALSPPSNVFMAASTSFLFVASPATGTRTVYSNTTPLEKKHFQEKNEICQQKEDQQKNARIHVLGQQAASTPTCLVDTFRDHDHRHFHVQHGGQGFSNQTFALFGADLRRCDPCKQQSLCNGPRKGWWCQR